MGWGNAGWIGDDGWYLNKSAFTTLDPSKKGTSISLSGGNLVVTGSGLGIALSTTGHSTGKYYFEVTMTAGATGVGFGNAAAGLNSFLGAGDNDSVACNSASAYFINGTQTGNGVTFTTGNIVSIAVDFGATNIWFRTNGGQWNGTSADPAANTGGLSFSTLNAGPYFAGATIGSGSDTSTFNFGASAYGFTPPSGFGNW